MFKQLLIVSMLVAGFASADEPTGVLEPPSQLHTSLFYIQADSQGRAEETLEKLKLAKSLVESGEDVGGLFSEQPYNPDHLIALYSTEITCNPERAHEIGQLQDYHCNRHGVSNVVVLLNLARRYQLVGCQMGDIQSKPVQTRLAMSQELQLEMVSVESFVKTKDSIKQDRMRAFEKLRPREVAELVAQYMRDSRKGPKFAAATRIIYNKHLKKVVGSTIDVLRNIDQALWCAAEPAPPSDRRAKLVADKL